MTPTVGRIVHVTLDDGTVRPAVITHVTNDETVDLFVFLSVKDYVTESRPTGRTFKGHTVAVKLPLAQDVPISKDEVSLPGMTSVPGCWNWPPHG